MHLFPPFRAPLTTAALARTLVIAALTLSGLATSARADIVSVADTVCEGKQAGDACKACESGAASGTCGVCTLPAPSCGAGSCRRHGDEQACVADGCTWGVGPLYCAGSACSCADGAPTAPTATIPSAPSAPSTSSCASSAPVSLGALALALLLALRRVRR